MQKTKLFFDTEFTGLHKNTTLVSIGIVSECGKTFYAEFTDYDKSQVDEWLQKNVIDKLFLGEIMFAADPDATQLTEWSNGKTVSIGNTNYIKKHLETWLRQFEMVEFYSDCLAFDWVLFCNIWGHAFDVPKNVYYIPFDICTLFAQKGIDPDISREKFAFGEVLTEMLAKKHTALYDAEVIKACYEKLVA